MAEEPTEATDSANVTPSIATTTGINTDPTNNSINETEDSSKDLEPETQPQTESTESLSTTKEINDPPNENKTENANNDETEALDDTNEVQNPSISPMDTDSDPQNKEDAAVHEDAPVMDPINEPQSQITSIEDIKMDDEPQNEENEPNQEQSDVGAVTDIEVEANVDPNVDSSAAVDDASAVEPPAMEEADTEKNEINQDAPDALDDPTIAANEDACDVEDAQISDDKAPPPIDTEPPQQEAMMMDQGQKSLSLSPRITVIKETWANKRRFGGNRLPLVACLRCNNHFFVEKTETHFTPTARQRNLKYAFTLIADQTEENVYQMIHIQSGSYLSVRQMGKHWVLYPVLDDDIIAIHPQDLQFTICKVSEQKDVNLRVTIGWNDKLLTTKEIQVTDTPLSPPKKPGLEQIDEMNVNTTVATLAALNDCEASFDLTNEEEDRKENHDGIPPIQLRQSSSLAHLDGTDKMLVFDTFHNEIIEAQVFILERVLDDVEDEQVDLMFLLDLVELPRANKIGIPSKLHQKYKHIPFALIELIQQIYVRIDVGKTGYAVYTDVWSQFVQYSEGMVPRVVITAFEDGVRDHDIAHKLIHIKNLISAIDTITEFYENEIKMERLEQERQMELKKLDPIDIKLRRLDVDILTEHPMLAQWQTMSSFRRKLYDWRIYLMDGWNSDGEDIGFFLWRQHLVAIQSNFGESIFAFFQFTRWLMILNVIMALFYGILIFTHALNFSFFAYGFGEYVDMALGNEFLHSWWFYGAYTAEYESMNYYLSYSVEFAWVAVSLCSVLISVIAVLRVLLMAGIKEDNEYVFSQNVFANYTHSVKHCDAVTLQRNSLMMRLHETLLQRIDEESSKLTCLVITKRMIGILLCLIVGVLSGVGIAALIYFESSVIVPYAQNLHYSMQSVAPYIVPAGVSVIKAMTPHVVRAIVVFESYSAEFLFQQTFFRVFLLRIFAILVSLFQTAQTAEKTENDEGAACAESQIGMVLYKFILFDMLIEIFVYAAVPSIKYCCRRYACGSIQNLTKEEELDELNKRSTLQKTEEERENESTPKQKQKTEFELAGDSWKAEFDIPGALVDVMYRQGIVWSGMYFSPMIPVMAVIASISTFFIKKSYLFRHCSRPKKALGVTKQLKFFYGMMLIAIIVSFVPFNYFLNRTPSCGPHAAHNVLSETETTLDRDMPAWLRTAFSYAFNGLLLLPLFILSLVYLGYVRGLRSVYAANAKQLKIRLLKEKDEKKQILTDYNIRL